LDPLSNVLATTPFPKIMTSAVPIISAICADMRECFEEDMQKGINDKEALMSLFVK
jgi:hypothetical protein